MESMVSKSNPIVIEEVKDPKELAAARAQRERFDRNAAWLQTHLAEIYSTNRGKVICVAGEEIFVADTAEEAIALGRAAQPADDGWFTRYIPKERLPRLYAI